MDETRTRRVALAEFLRDKREQVPPSGRPRGLGRRRRPGLRRQEIAQLVGVSVTWYSWLEDGRDVRPNRQVLDALARALRLSGEERTTLFTLAEAPDGPAPVTVPAAVRDLVGALAPNPAYVLDRYWDVVAHNRSANRLLGTGTGTGTDTGTGTVADPAARNLLWLMFAAAGPRERMVDWARHARALCAEFRARAAAHPNDERFRALAERVGQASPEFRDFSRETGPVPTGDLRQFRCPEFGLLTFTRVALCPLGTADVQVVTHLPADPGTTDAVHRLALATG